MLVSKKDGKVRMCANFRDLKKANPNDDFALPHIDVLVEITPLAMPSFLSWMAMPDIIKSK